MKNFLFIYRSDASTGARPSPEQLQANTKKWMDWIGGIAAQNKLVDRGNRLEQSGKVAKSDSVVTDGPYSDIKEILGGYSIVKADSYQEAITLSRGCPIYDVGGNLEIREVSEM